MDGRPDAFSYFTQFWLRSTLSVSGASFEQVCAFALSKWQTHYMYLCVFDNIVYYVRDASSSSSYWRLARPSCSAASVGVERVFSMVAFRNVWIACTTNMKTHWQHLEQQQREKKIDFRRNIRCRCCCERSTFFFLFSSCLDLFAAGVFIRWHFFFGSENVPVNRHRMASHLVFRILSDALWMESHRKIRNAMWCEYRRRREPQIIRQGHTTAWIKTIESVYSMIVIRTRSTRSTSFRSSSSVSIAIFQINKRTYSFSISVVASDSPLWSDHHRSNSNYITWNSIVLNDTHSIG